MAEKVNIFIKDSEACCNLLLWISIVPVEDGEEEGVEGAKPGEERESSHATAGGPSEPKRQSLQQYQAVVEEKVTFCEVTSRQLSGVFPYSPAADATTRRKE